MKRVAITRKCRICKRYKPNNSKAFRYNGGGKRGLRRACRACESQYQKQFAAGHREDYKGWSASNYIKWREAVLELLGNKCAWCSFEDKRALQVDHVNGGGCYNTYRIGTKKHFEYVKANPTLYQCLCANCNWIKRAENGEQRRISCAT